jgi:hypothetical protein
MNRSTILETLLPFAGVGKPTIPVSDANLLLEVVK